MPPALTTPDSSIFYWVTNTVGNYVEISTQLEFLQKQFCLVAETVGGVSIGILITVEICGYETIILNSPPDAT